MVVLFSARHFFWYCFNSSISLIHCTAGIPVTRLHAGSPYASGGMSLPVVPPALGSQHWDPSLLTPAASRVVMSDKTACDSHYCTWSLTQVSACLLAMPAGKQIGLTCISGWNSQKRISFRMIQILFTSSNKQMFTNYSTGFHISRCLNRRKYVYCLFPTEINRKKCCLTPGTCSSLPKSATVT